jgi:hypothetical protein
VPRHAELVDWFASSGLDDLSYRKRFPA